MSKQLSAEWEDKIYQEAQQRPKDRSHGYCFGWSDGYEAGATKYVLELVEAQERIKSLEEALNKIKWMAAVHTGINSNILGIWKCANESLLPNNKQKEDE